jgi:photosystem II stability/assembly factor-like uncharacterized protein
MATPERSRHRSRWLVACLLSLVALPFSAVAAEFAPRMLLLDGAIAGPAVVVVGERGTILRSTDNAQTWQPATIPTGATLTGVSFADAQHGWAVGHDALILGTNDGGLTWVRQWQGENLTDSFLDVLALDGGHVIAVGAYGLFVSTSDGGGTWIRRRVTPDDFHFNRISRGPTGTLYLAGEHGTLLRSANGGIDWMRLAAPYEGSFFGVLPLDQRTLLAYGLRGRVYRSTDDGASWKIIPTTDPVLLATAVKLKSNFIVLAGQVRGLLVSTDYGETLVRRAAGANAIAELLELPDGNLLTLGEGGATRVELDRIVRAAQPGSAAPLPTQRTPQTAR